MNNWGWLDSLDSNIMKSVEAFAGDVRDPNGICTAMKGCEAVIHMVALIAIPYSYYSPDSYVYSNIKGTLKVLQDAREYHFLLDMV